MSGIFTRSKIIKTALFTITPPDFLRQIGWQFVRRGSWLAMKVCPFCDGGRSGDQFTFVVHASDGNYSCQRSKCGASGSFWALLEGQNYNPRDLLSDGAKKQNRKKKRKKFVYGKS